MAAGTDLETIVLIGKGHHIEGLISGTPKPGTVMQMVAATEPVNGKYTWEVFNQAADGDRPAGPLAVLKEDSLQGKTVADAYVSGTLGQLYIPTNGDLLNMLYANIAGTGDTFAIADKLIVDDGTGKLIATTGSPETEPFTCAETQSTALTADKLLKTYFTGF